MIAVMWENLLLVGRILLFCGELIAQSYAAGLPSRSAGPDTSAELINKIINQMNHSKSDAVFRKAPAKTSCISIRLHIR